MGCSSCGKSSGKKKINKLKASKTKTLKETVIVHNGKTYKAKIR